MAEAQPQPPPPQPLSLAEWLSGLDASRMHDTIVDQGFNTVEDLLVLTEADLVELGDEAAEAGGAEAAGSGVVCVCGTLRLSRSTPTWLGSGSAGASSCRWACRRRWAAPGG